MIKARKQLKIYKCWNDARKDLEKYLNQKTTKYVEYVNLLYGSSFIYIEYKFPILIKEKNRTNFNIYSITELQKITEYQYNYYFTYLRHKLNKFYTTELDCKDI